VVRAVEQGSHLAGDVVREHGRRLGDRCGRSIWIVVCQAVS
jgi:hypothetical protein